MDSNSIDYIDLIDQLNEESIKYCAEEMSELLLFRFLKSDDVRNIDLKERLIPLLEPVSEEKYPYISYGTADIYYSMLNDYLKFYCICENGGRAEQYKTRASKIRISDSTADTLIYLIQDILLVFISIFREYGDIEHAKMKKYISDARFTVELNDAKILKGIWKSKADTIIEKLVPQPKGLFSDATFYKKSCEKSRLNYKNFFYITSMLLLTLMLQERGVFEKKD